MTRAAGIFAAIALAAWAVHPGSAYSLRGRTWASNPTMQLQLGSSSGTLIDGSTSWGSSVESAMSIWNSNISTIQFRVTRDSNAANASGNGLNNIVWGNDVYGDPFGSETLAVAVSWSRGNNYTEGDIVFNTAKSWNSYRGNLRSAGGGVTLNDIRRVALHELGHVLGLAHPDENGQSVSAIMNSRTSNLDTLQSDDINGGRAMYGTGSSTPTTPTNRAPTVTASCSPCTVQTGNAATVSASGSDADRDSLTYRWSASSGTFGNANSSSTTWTAPTSTGTYSISVTVSDGRGGSASSSVSIQVIPRDRLAAGERLTAGQSITSVNRRWRLLYQSDGNLVLYDDVGMGAAWASNTSSTAGSALLQGDGNLVLYDGQGRAIWATNTPGNPNSRMILQDDGNLVIYNAAGQPVWHRFQ